MTITAKFPGKCRKCGQAISVGEQIEWAKGEGSSHVECDPMALMEAWATKAEQSVLLDVEAGLHAFLDDPAKQEGMTRETIAVAEAQRQILVAEITRRANAEAGVEQPERGGKPEACEPGVYERDGEIYIVKPNREKTRVYAKRLVEIALSTPRVLEDGTEVNYDIEFEYAKGAIYDLSESDRMDTARAEQLAIRYGRCINCGRSLKTAESVKRGIGPVCMKRFKAVA